MALLDEGLKELGIPDSLVEKVSEQMEKYISEIILFNSAYNLTNTSDHDELVIRHIFDSLSAYKNIEALLLKKTSEEETSINELSLGDIGSGGGLPGIPLAACFPDVQFTLVERMSKRCAFLENCAAILGLKNVTVLNSEAEKVPAEKFDLITFRAFRPLDEKMTKTLLRMIKNGGYMCAYKAKKENILEEMAGIKTLVPDYSLSGLCVPHLNDTERHLVVVKK